MIIAGVDNGFSGAVALIDKKDNGIYIKKMPLLKNEKNEIDEQELRSILEMADHVVIEKAQAMPKQGISSTSRYMMSYGIVRGLCAGLQKPYTLVTPQRWKKLLLSDMPKGKEASIIKAQQLYPHLKLGRNHNLADAVMLAVYGLRSL